MALIRRLHCLVMSVKPGWSGGTRASIGRLSDEQSKINCAKSIGEGLSRMMLQGLYCMTVFRRVGSLSYLVLAVVLHTARMWG